MRRSSIALLLLTMLAGLLAIAGCGSNTASSSSAAYAPSPMATSTGSARETACNGVSNINKALTSLSNVSANATVGDVKAAQTKVTNAVNAIQAQHPTDPQGLVNQLSTANAKLTEKLAGYPDQTPIGQTSENIQDLKARVAEAQTKTNQLSGELKCTA